MNSGSSVRWEERNVDASSSQPLRHRDSVMRTFLESDVDFEWPAKFGECSGNHCDISLDVGNIPLIWKKKISDKNASIDMYEADSDYRFKKPFVVKTIRETDSQKARKMTAKEVENMKDLRHPHVAALLATFTYQARLHILIFPAACCDLHEFMKRMSRGFEKDQVASHSDGTSTVDSDTTISKHLQNPNVGSANKHREHDAQEIYSEPWPLTIPVDEKNELLRTYFVCLSQALSYLHASGVRHKDIKPANILIDESGSVILTDFGISRRFPKHTPHATNNERNFTRKYASPEMMEDETTLRDDPSDVFSLGCVFLEMATLLLGKNLHNLSDHYATIVNVSSKEEAYHCNLGSVHSWIDYLRTSRGFEPVQEHWLPGNRNEVSGFNPSPDNHMTAALVDIRQMLDETPSNRPESEGLWQRFQHISATKCRDCDPRRQLDIWKPSAKQQRDAQTGLNNRRSLHAIEEKDLKSRELSVSGDNKEVMTREETRPEVAQASARNSPADVVQGTSTDTGHHLSHNVESTRPQATKIGLLNRRAVRQGLQSRTPNQTRATVDENSVSELEMYTSPQTRIIVYDVSQTIAFETIFASLKGTCISPSQRLLMRRCPNVAPDQDFKRYRLPRFRRKVEIGDKADLIAKVDLGQLKPGTKIRRWTGRFPWIYVLNYAAQPLQRRTG